MARRPFALLLIVAAIVLSGCWDRIEVNDLAVVSLVGIDQAEQGIRVTVNIVAPKQAGTGGGGGGAPGQATGFVVYSSEGSTTLEALRRMQLSLPRRLFFGHARALVLGREFAQAGIRPAIDFWSRHPESRLLMRMMVAENQAEELLRAAPKLEKLLSEALRETINLSGRSRTMLRDIIPELRNGGNPVMPTIRVVLGPDGQQDVIVSGSAVFDGDRLIGYLGAGEMVWLKWIQGNADRAVVSVNAGRHKASFQLLRAGSFVRPEHVNGRLQIRIWASAEARLMENSADLDVQKAGVLPLLRQTLEDQVRRQITRLVRRSQEEIRRDFLGMGDAVHRWFPAQWERTLKARWVQVYPEIPVVVDVSVPILSTGAHSRSLVEP